jgi:hypothetical protein
MEIKYKYGIISADRAKQIKTKAIVNEDPTEALIRELRQGASLIYKRFEPYLQSILFKFNISRDVTMSLKNVLLRLMEYKGYADLTWKYLLRSSENQVVFIFNRSHYKRFN